MRVAVIGSTGLKVDLSPYMPEYSTEIISDGTEGIGTLAECWADKNKIPKLIIRSRYASAAPIHINRLVIDMADCVIAIWDGASIDTKNTIEYAQKIGKCVHIYTL